MKNKCFKKRTLSLFVYFYPRHRGYQLQICLSGLDIGIPHHSIHISNGSGFPRLARTGGTARGNILNTLKGCCVLWFWHNTSQRQSAGWSYAFSFSYLVMLEWSIRCRGKPIHKLKLVLHCLIVRKSEVSVYTGVDFELRIIIIN